MADRIITAIDIGSSKIATVIALQEPNKAPSVIGVSSYPSQGLKKGVIINIDDAINSIAASLEAAERMAGITVSSVYISINGKHITSTNNKGVVAVAQDEINGDDIFRAIETAKTVSIPPSREILHVIPRQFIVDAQGDIKDPIGMTGNRLEVDTHIISATSSALHNIVRCITQIGLKIDDVVFSGWAASNSVLTNTEKELGIVLLDIGGGTTTITTFVEDAITYSGSVPFGGANVTSDIAIGLRVNLEDAEKIKLNADELMRNSKRPMTSEATKKRQLLLNQKADDDDEEKEPDVKKKDIIDVTSLDVDGVKTISKKMFEDIIEARLSEIFDIVIQQIEQSGYEARLPAGVVITGGSSMIPGITSIAKKVFGVPARIGHPKGLDGLIDEISNPGYAVAQGLILSGASDETFSAGRKQISLKASKGDNPLGKVFGFLRNLIP
jgi:cell division protein FtsA